MGEFTTTLKVLAVVGLAVASLPGHGHAGDGVGNGGGGAEKIVLQAHSQLPQILNDCLSSPHCVHGRGTAILTRIQKGLQTHPPEPYRILFRDSHEFPFNQFPDEPPRSARTGTLIGGKIYINRDHLYLKQGVLEIPISFPEAVALLIDEYAHQTGFPDDEDHSVLDHVCHNVERFLSRRVQALYEINGLHGGTDYQGIMVTAYSGYLPVGYSEFLVTNPTVSSGGPLSGKTYALADQIRSVLLCPERGPGDGGEWTVVGYSINNLHWTTLSTDYNFQRTMALESFISYTCEYRLPEWETGFRSVQIGTLQVLLEFEPHKNKTDYRNLVSDTTVKFTPLYRSLPGEDMRVMKKPY